MSAWVTSDRFSLVMVVNGDSHSPATCIFYFDLIQRPLVAEIALQSARL